jgi:hypothetical protein
MGVELVYHDFDDESPESPFEKTIVQLSEDATLDIACPYLGLDLLRSIVDRSRSWRLVTDLQALVRSQPREHREDLLNFVQTNRESIHDCRDLHAKVFLGNDAGLVGSTKFTYSGLAKNPEMAVLFEDTEEVDELTTWFGDLWERTQAPNVEDLSRYLTETERPEREDQSSPSMPDVGPSVDTSLQVLGKPTIEVEESDQQRLVETVSEAPSRDWVDTYFDWIVEVIDCAQLDESDERIATTVPGSSVRIPVNVNHRYVLAAFPERQSIGIILPPESIALDELSKFVSDFGAFSTDSDEDPYWFEFPGDPDEFISEEIKRDWRRMVRKEANRGTRSEYRHHHNPAAYKAAVDEEYRENILDTAFSSQTQ